MRLAIISDAVLATPTPGGHGLGRMVSQIAEGLLARGHDVTLFAKPGSRFSGALITPPDAVGYEGERALAREVMRVHRGRAFDGVLDNSHLHWVAHMFPDMPTVNVYHDCFQNYVRCPVLLSQGQRALMPPAFDGAAIVPNTLDAAEFIPSIAHAPQEYAFFCGALSEMKQVVLAMEACARYGMPLIIAGQPVLGQFPVGSSNNCEYVGTVVGVQRDNLYRGATVFLQLGYIESFGLTTLEANLCGTPIVAWASGGSVDIVHDGINGVFVCSIGNDKVEAVAQAIERAKWLDRTKVRAYAETLCNVDRQLDAYEELCKRVILGERW
jgi:glycosyltransferase involved in cell wall biosynthesis